jgi:exopolysaccharide production protein ExoQ
MSMAVIAVAVVVLNLMTALAVRAWAARTLYGVGLAVSLLAGAGLGLLDGAGPAPIYAFRVAAAVAIVLLAANHLPAVVRRLVREGWLAATFAWGVLSLLWTDSASATLISLFGFAASILFGAYLAERQTPENLFKCLAVSCGVLALVSLVLLVLRPDLVVTTVYRPEEGFRNSNVGVFTWNSEFGVTAALGLLAAVAVAHPGRRRYILWVLPTAMAALLSDSATSLAAVFAATVLLLVLRSRYLLAWGFYAFLAAFAVVAQAGSPSGLALRLLGRSSDLTGRSFIWSSIFERVQERPAFGFGFGAGFADPTFFTDFYTFDPEHAHNGLVQAYNELGIVGLALVVGGFAAAYWRTTTRLRASQRATVLAFLTFVLLLNMANNYLLAMHLIVAVYAWAACLPVGTRPLPGSEGRSWIPAPLWPATTAEGEDRDASADPGVDSDLVLDESAGSGRRASSDS